MNRKVLSTATKELNKAKAPARPKDILFDPSGQGMLNPKYAGKPVRLATDTLYNPTKYNIKAYADNGMSARLNSYDTTNVTLEGAKYIDEYPELQEGSIYMDGDLSQEEIDYYAKGGFIVEDISVPELTKAQKGLTKKPLEISDPEEFKYRSRMYADSSNLYKAYQMQDKLMGPGNYKTKDKYKWNTAELKAARKNNTDFQSEAHQFEEGYHPWWASKEDKQLLDYYKKLGFKPNQIMYHSSPDLVNDKIKAVGSYFDGNAVSPIYKKPTQPVVFKKAPENQIVPTVQQMVTPAKVVQPTQKKVVAPVVQPKPTPPSKITAYKTQTVMYPDGSYELRRVPYYTGNDKGTWTQGTKLNPPGVVNAIDLSPEEQQTLKNKNKLKSKKEGGALLTKKVTCKSCGWKWDAADGGDDITTCHKCGGQGLIHAKVGVTVDNEEPKRRRFVPGTYNPETTVGYVEELPEAQVEAKAPEWVTYAREYEKKKSKQDFINDKKREYLKRNTGLNKAAGVTMDNFPETVEQNFAGEYEYKRNSYIAKRYGKKHGFNPKRRGEWVEQLSPGTKAVIANSKYGSKLQPSYWSRAAAGLMNYGQLLPGEQPYVQIPGLTKKEQKEILNSKLGALEMLAPLDIPGAVIANYLKNRGISTGSDYRELPGIGSGQKMSNVSDLDAMGLNPINLVGLAGIGEMGINLVRGAKALPGAAKTLNKVKDVVVKPLVNYGTDVVETSRAAGKLQLPKYKDVYRVEHAGFNKTANADDLTGRWFEDNPMGAKFYAKKLKDPVTGEMINDATAPVRVMKKRLPEYKVNQSFGAAMPEEARIMSMGKGDLTNTQLDELLGPGASDRFNMGSNNYGKFTEQDFNSMETAPFLFRKEEGILNPDVVNDLRSKSKNFENQEGALDYLNAETNRIVNQKKFQSYLPYKEGGIISKLSKKQIQDLIKQGYVIEEQ